MRSNLVPWAPCRPAQKAPAGGGYAIPRGLKVLEDEWKADGGPYDCVHFVSIEPGQWGAVLRHVCRYLASLVYYGPTVHTWVRVSHISSPYLVGLEGMVS